MSMILHNYYAAKEGIVELLAVEQIHIQLKV